MARALWKGAISFGLVNIPVELYPAEDRKSFKFSMLDKRDLSPVGYKRYNKAIGKEVAVGRHRQGLRVREGPVRRALDEDFQQANVKATQTIDIRAFVEAERDSARVLRDAVLPRAGARGEKVYALLRETLKSDRPRRGGGGRAAHHAAPRRRSIRTARR